MKRFAITWKDSVLSLSILATTFLLCLLLHKFASFYGLTGMVLVLSVFLVSVFTQGYICGIAGKLLSPGYKWYVLFFYILNFIMVGADLALYVRNYRLDKEREAEK